MRLLFFAAVRLVDGGKGAVPDGWEIEAEKHSDRKVVFNHGSRPGEQHEQTLEMEFWW